MALPKDLAGKIADAKNFYNRVSGKPNDWGLTTAQLDALKTSYDLTDTKIEAQTNADAEKKRTTIEKNEAAADFIGLYQQLRGVAQAHPETTDAMRASVGLSTGESVEKDPSEFETAPLVVVEQAGIHAQNVRFFMNGKKSTSTELPDGADGAQVLVKIGGEATDNLNDYLKIAFDSKAPYYYEHNPADAGKYAHFIVRWATDDGISFSPQSAAFTIIIT